MAALRRRAWEHAEAIAADAVSAAIRRHQLQVVGAAAAVAAVAAVNAGDVQSCRAASPTHPSRLQHARHLTLSPAPSYDNTYDNKL